MSIVDQVKAIAPGGNGTSINNNNRRSCCPIRLCCAINHNWINNCRISSSRLKNMRTATGDVKSDHIFIYIRIGFYNSLSERSGATVCSTRDRNGCLTVKRACYEEKSNCKGSGQTWGNSEHVKPLHMKKI